MADKVKADFLKADFKTLFQKKPKNTDVAEAIDPANIEAYKPRLPEVNLLPANIKEEYVAKELGGKFKKTIAGVVIAFAVIGGISFVTGSMNQKKIDNITAETSAINAQVQQMTPFDTYQKAVQTKRTQLSAAMDKDLKIAELNANFINAATSSGYGVQKISVSSGSADASGTGGNGACVNPDPFSPTVGVGCVSFSLTGDGNLANFFLELNKEDKGFVNAYVPKANLGSGDQVALVEGTVGFTELYYSKKFSSLTNPIETVLDPNAVATPNANNPAPTPSTPANPADGNSVDVSNLPEVVTNQ